MNKNQDAQQLVSEEQVEVRLKIPPGDYRGIDRSDDKLMDKIRMDVSEDLGEFMMATTYSPSKFYVIVKNYLLERRGLCRVLDCDDVIEASMNATMIALMTIFTKNQLCMLDSSDDDEKDDDDREMQYAIKALKALRKALKSKARREDFDRFCCSQYGVSHHPLTDEEKQEMAFVGNIDNHIKAES